MGTEYFEPQYEDENVKEHIHNSGGEKPELTCISEEGIADMDLPDNFLDDLDFVGDCITSCDKVENYLMLSEFENNLNAELPILLEKKGRRFSLPKNKQPNSNGHRKDKENVEETQEFKSIKKLNSKWQPPGYLNNRAISVIDEASV